MITTNRRQFVNLRIFGILLGISISFSLSAQTWNLITTATTSDASASSYFGSAVAMDGDYAVSRAVGAIYIFKRDETTYAWIQKQKILISSSYNYGNCSVAISGNYIAVIGGSSVTTGSLYIFERDVANDTWSQQKVLTPSDATGFSGAVSISGSYIVAGATSESEDANGSNTISNAGAAYIYEQVSGIWLEQQKIVANSNRNANSYFGNSVGISGNNIVIGASGYDADISDSYCTVGNAYVYVRDPISDIWSVQGNIFTGVNPSLYDVDEAITALVSSVSICDKYIAVGSYKNVRLYGYGNNGYYNNNYFYGGAVSIYKKNSAGNWILQQTLYNTSTWNGYYYNDEYNPYVNSLSISGEYLYYSYSSWRYLYKNDLLGTWAQLQTFSSGNSVCLKDEDLTIGDNSTDTNTGTVYFYKMAPYTTLLSTTASIGSTQNLTTSVNLIYNTPFTATSNQPWLNVSPSSISPVVISDTVPLTFTASVNNTTSARTAKVTIAGTGVSNQYVIITQYADPVITWATPADITYGTALISTQLNATANVEGTFTYTPSLSTVLNAGTAQTLRVDFTPKDAANYSSASKTVQINVKKVVPSITWTTPTDITYGAALNSTQLNATSNVVGTCTYNPIAGTKLNAGSGQTLSVRFTPMDTVNFEYADKTVQLNVKKATPVITWSNPTDIYYGETLSSTQLNATADVEGSFTYNPAIGTKLNVGNGQSLSTQFKASDEINYELVNKQFSVNVIQPILSVSTATVNISFTGRETSTLTINSNCPWVATSDQKWLTLSSSSGTGDGTIILSTTENNTDFDRTAIITIKGSGGTSKTITVTQTKKLQIIANIIRKWNDVLVCNNSDKLFIDYQWYKNDVSIIGETKQYYQELGGLNGNYYVKVTTSDGTSGISNTIIDVSKASKSIKAYPNPTQVNQNFSLEIKATESDLKQAELTISSVSGQVIFRDNNLQQQMQLNGLSRGCYIIHIRLKNGELLSEKLMVN